MKLNRCIQCGGDFVDDDFDKESHMCYDCCETDPDDFDYDDDVEYYYDE